MSALPGKFSSIADAVKIGVDPWHFVCLVSIEADFGRKYQQGLKGTAVDAVGHDHGTARIPALVCAVVILGERAGKRQVFKGRHVNARPRQFDCIDNTRQRAVCVFGTVKPRGDEVA